MHTKFFLYMLIKITITFNDIETHYGIPENTTGSMEIHSNPAAI